MYLIFKERIFKEIKAFPRKKIIRQGLRNNGLIVYAKKESDIVEAINIISFLIISSSLCKVAFDTTTPPIFTGFILATGVKAPVLPTWISIFNISENELSEENLCATAHLGALATKPNLFCKEKSFTL